MSLPDPIVTKWYVGGEPYQTSTPRAPGETDHEFLVRHGDQILHEMEVIRDSLTCEEMGVETLSVDEDTLASFVDRHVQRLEEVI